MEILGVDFRSSCMENKHSSTELHSLCKSREGALGCPCWGGETLVQGPFLDSPSWAALGIQTSETLPWETPSCTREETMW